MVVDSVVTPRNCWNDAVTTAFTYGRKHEASRLRAWLPSADSRRRTGLQETATLIVAAAAGVADLNKGASEGLSAW